MSQGPACTAWVSGDPPSVACHETGVLGESLPLLPPPRSEHTQSRAGPARAAERQSPCPVTVRRHKLGGTPELGVACHVADECTGPRERPQEPLRPSARCGSQPYLGGQPQQEDCSCFSGHREGQQGPAGSGTGPLFPDSPTWPCRSCPVNFPTESLEV